MLYIPYPFTRCTCCKVEYPTSRLYFSPNKTKNNGLGSRCKFCTREYARTHYDPEKEKARYKARSEERRVTEKRYRETHTKETHERGKRWYAANREKVNKRARENYKAKKEQYHARVRNRRAREHAINGTHTDKDIAEQYKRQKGCCYYCGRKLGKRYHVDHVIPITRGGTNDPSNLVIACPYCNRSKANKLPHEWPEGGRLC